MKNWLFILLAASVASSLPALAEDKKPDAPVKKICRRYDTTGSIVGFQRVCHTAAEWAKIDQGNNDIARSATDPVGRFGGFAGPRGS